MEEKQCTCSCHTFGASSPKSFCYGWGDKFCCAKHDVKHPAWLTRINQQLKGTALAQLRTESTSLRSEGELVGWVRRIDIPEHIKTVLLRELAAIGFHCANFDDVCQFDVSGSKQWVLEVLEQHL